MLPQLTCRKDHQVCKLLASHEIQQPPGLLLFPTVQASRSPGHFGGLEIEFFQVALACADAEPGLHCRTATLQTAGVQTGCGLRELRVEPGRGRQAGAVPNSPLSLCISAFILFLSQNDPASEV